MFGKSRPAAVQLRGLSGEGFKRLARDLYDKAYLDTMHEILTGPGMNVFYDRENDTRDVWLRGDLAEALKRHVTIRSLEDEYR